MTEPSSGRSPGRGAGSGAAPRPGRGAPPLHILMIAPQPFFRARGTPFSVLHRIRALVGLGHTVDLVTYPFGEDPDVEGLTVHRAGRPVGVRDVPIGPSVRKALLDVPLFLRALRLARSGEHDLLHTHEEAGAMGAWIGRRTGLPHLYDMHSSLPEQLDNFGRFDWAPVVAAFEAMEAYTLGGSDGVIAVCRELGERVAASGYRGPVRVIENTLDVAPPSYGEADESALRERLGLEEGGKVVLYTGTFEPYQGLPVLIRAARRVVERAPEARFVLLGGTDAEIQRLRDVVASNAVEESVVLVPRVDPEEVFLFHRIADVLVTARTGGTNTPLKIYQYLRAGLPIVATDVPSHTQVLSRETAELVPPDPPGLAGGILRVLEDREHARRLAEGAVRLAHSEYGEEAYVSELSSLLGEVAGGDPVSGGTRARDGGRDERRWQLEMFRRTLKKRQKLRLLLDQLGSLDAERCLLLTNGDNNGALNHHFREAGGRWTWGEFEEEPVEQLEAFLGDPVHHVSPGDFPFGDGTFDRIVVIDVHEHLREVDPLNRELARVLAPGGLAVVTVPNGDTGLPVTVLKRWVGMGPSEYGHVVQGYEVGELERMLSAVGLEPESRGAYSRFFTELAELMINFAYVKVLSSNDGGESGEGKIAPTDRDDLASVGTAYRAYSLVYPFVRAFSMLDLLIPGQGGYAVSVAARKNG